MIFPNLSLETVMQVEDKLRIDASRSFVTQGEVVTDVLIQPEGTDVFISVFTADQEDWYLDWAYTTDGIKSVVCRVETDITPAGRTRTYSITVLTVLEDTLFSGDNNLLPYEPDVLQYLPNGKNSYLYAHRKAQDLIIAYLDEQRIWKKDRTRITKQDIAAITDDEVRYQFEQWSAFQALLIIFESVQVSNDDIFQEKKANYEVLRDQARNRSALRLDLSGDDTLDEIPYDIRTMRMVRR